MRHGQVVLAILPSSAKCLGWTLPKSSSSSPYRETPTSGNTLTTRVSNWAAADTMTTARTSCCDSHTAEGVQTAKGRTAATGSVPSTIWEMRCTSPNSTCRSNGLEFGPTQ